MDRAALSSLLRSFERHLRAENRSERTVASYLVALRQAEAFLAARGVGLVDAGQLRLALAVFREVGDRQGQGQTLGMLGFAFALQGRLEAAAAHYRQALSIWRELGDRQGQGETLNHLGAVLAEQGRLGEAHDHYSQALAIARAVGDRRTEAAILDNLGKALAEQGDASWRAALVIYEQLGAPEAQRLRQKLKQPDRQPRRSWPFGRRRG
jgi:tetratricopeptide (TPR) repeat protein